MPASWLRATVATAKPIAPCSVRATQPLATDSGSLPNVEVSPAPSVGTPASNAPTYAPTRPTPYAMTIPSASMTAIAANVPSRYQLRPSPRATAFLSVPQLHSEPAMAAPYTRASNPPNPRMNPSTSSYAPGNVTSSSASAPPSWLPSCRAVAPTAMNTSNNRPMSSPNVTKLAGRRTSLRSAATKTLTRLHPARSPDDRRRES
jgi:hypothetical protein